LDIFKSPFGSFVIDTQSRFCGWKPKSIARLTLSARHNLNRRLQQFVTGIMSNFDGIQPQAAVDGKGIFHMLVEALPCGVVLHD
jgi:hypothetical protein